MPRNTANLPDRELELTKESVAAERRRVFGTIQWCKRCCRRHGSRQPCNLIEVEVDVAHGNRRGRRRGRAIVTQKRWVHP